MPSPSSASRRVREQTALLVLFEPEGTLLYGNAALAASALQDALEDLYQVAIEGNPEENFSGGGTTWQNAGSLLLRAGVDEFAIRRRLRAWAAYAGDLYQTRLLEDDISGHVAAGAQELLEELTAVGHLLGVVSLQVRAITRLRLAAAGLLDLLPVAAAADDVNYHTQLYTCARRHAAQHQEERPGVSWPAERTVALSASPSLASRAHTDPVYAISLKDPLAARPSRAVDHVVESLPEFAAYLTHFVTERPSIPNPTDPLRYL
jgi:beta-phosphoglucomutase-like phosphatase (HAD superfamily)